MLEASDKDQIQSVYDWLKRSKSHYLCIEQPYNVDSKKKDSEANQRIISIFFARRKTAISFNISFKGDVNILNERYPLKRNDD